MKRKTLLISISLLALTCLVTAGALLSRSRSTAIASAGFVPSSRSAGTVPAKPDAVASASAAASTAKTAAAPAPSVAEHRAKRPHSARAATKRVVAENEQLGHRVAFAEAGDSTDADQDQKAKPTDEQMALWARAQGASVSPVLSPRLKDVPPIRTTHDPKVEVENFTLPYRGLTAGNLPVHPDGALQTHFGPDAPTPTGVNFPGVGVNNSAPSDDNGHVGPSHYVQWVNSQFAIYDKSGSILYGPANGNTLFTALGGVCAASNNGDPIAQYDILADRWVLSQFSVDQPPTGLASHQCVAVSVTGDPLGAYYLYDFPLSPNLLYDYPHMSTWPDSYYTTFHVFDQTLPAASQYQNEAVVAFERGAMILGVPARLQIGSLGTPGLGEFFGGLAADLESLTPPPAGSPEYVLAPASPEWDGSPVPGIHFWTIATTWGGTPSMTITQEADIVTASYQTNLCGFSRNCINEPPPAGVNDKLDSLTGRFMYRVAYRNNAGTESIIGVQTVNALTPPANQAALRWYELRTPATTPTIFQQGTYAPDSDHRWTGSVAMDNSGNIALGFSKSSTTTKPEIDVTGRLSGDPLGTMGAEVTMQPGIGVQQVTGNRWGDYSGMSLDPRDQCTFWYTNQYIPVTGQFTWGTRIASFRFPAGNCTTPPKGTLTGTVRDGDGNLVAGAVVELDNGFSAATNEFGVYTLVTSPGTYDAGVVAALRPGCVSPPGSVVTITNAAVTTRNFTLSGTATLAFGGFSIDDSIGNGNGVINRNECVIINIAADNIGCATATGVSGTISTTTPGVTVTPATSGFANIAAGQTASNTTPFILTTSSTFVCGTPIDLSGTLNSSAGSVPFSFSVPTCQKTITLTGSIAAVSPTQTGRLARNGVVSTCAPKATPALQDSAVRHYDLHTFVNDTPYAVCATFTTSTPCAAIEPVAYLGPFNPAAIQTNYLGDGGASPAPLGSFKATIPPGGSVDLAVNEVTPNSFCSGYTTVITGLLDDTDGGRPAAPTAGNDGPVCEGGTLQLTATTVPGATYAWTGPNGFTSNQQNPVLTNVVPAQSGTYSVVATVGSCSTDAATTVVTINPTPAAPTAGSNSPVAAGGTINLTASTVAGATYAWTGPSGFTSPLQNPSISGATAANAGVYSVVATIGTCSSAAGTTTVVISDFTPQTLQVDQAFVSGTSSNANNVFEQGEIVLVNPGWTNLGSAPVDLTGTASNFTGPAGPTYTIVDGSADYGPVSPGATTNCRTATGNCYELGISAGARPTAHWDTTVDENLSDGTTKTWTLHVGGSFSDVPVGSGFYRFVETIFHKGITSGCGAGVFCPASAVNRAQDAVFLLLAEHGSGYTPPPAQGIFNDVPVSSPFAPFVEQLVAEGITAGCGNNNFCPADPVTRAQSAVFLLRAEHGPAYTPPPAVGLFSDVPVSSPFAPYVEQLVAEGITVGCGGGKFCPADPVLRGQNAVFLTVTFKLNLYGP